MLMVFKMVSPNVRVISVGRAGPNLIYITLYGRRWQDFGGDLYFGDFQKNNRGEEITPAERLTYCF